jgi:hypothetical protein
MTKLLLAILIIITGVKLFTDSGALVFKYSTVKLLLEDEEGKKQNDEQKDSKQDNEDFFYAHYLVHSAIVSRTGTLQFSLTQHKLHKGFADKPFTPPDAI